MGIKMTITWNFISMFYLTHRIVYAQISYNLMCWVTMRLIIFSCFLFFSFLLSFFFFFSKENGTFFEKEYMESQRNVYVRMFGIHRLLTVYKWIGNWKLIILFSEGWVEPITMVFYEISFKVIAFEYKTLLKNGIRFSFFWAIVAWSLPYKLARIWCSFLCTFSLKHLTFTIEKIVFPLLLWMQFKYILNVNVMYSKECDCIVGLGNTFKVPDGTFRMEMSVFFEPVLELHVILNLHFNPLFLLAAICLWYSQQELVTHTWRTAQNSYSSIPSRRGMCRS